MAEAEAEAAALEFVLQAAALLPRVRPALGLLESLTAVSAKLSDLQLYGISLTARAPPGSQSREKTRPPLILPWIAKAFLRTERQAFLVELLLGRLAELLEEIRLQERSSDLAEEAAEEQQSLQSDQNHHPQQQAEAQRRAAAEAARCSLPVAVCLWIATSRFKARETAAAGVNVKRVGSAAQAAAFAARHFVAGEELPSDSAPYVAA